MNAYKRKQSENKFLKAANTPPVKTTTNIPAMWRNEDDINVTLNNLKVTGLFMKLLI
jgi:hypothetical protein